jgi:hypothetical protein
MALLVAKDRLLCGSDAIGVPPGTHEPLDLRRCGTTCRVQEPPLILRRGHTSDGPNLRVGELTPLHRITDHWQYGQRTSDANLLARGAEGDAGAPVQPMRTREKATIPACRVIELTKQREQLIRGRVDAGGKLRDGLAELLGIAGAIGTRRASLGVDAA